MAATSTVIGRPGKGARGASNIRLPIRVWRNLSKRAKDEGISRNDLILKILESWTARQKKRETAQV